MPQKREYFLGGMQDKKIVHQGMSEHAQVDRPTGGKQKFICHLT
jgi:hypothetical protein